MTCRPRWGRHNLGVHVHVLDTPGPMTRTETLPLLAFALLATACASAAPEAAPPEPSTGVYTDAQAARGRASFQTTCFECHYPSEFRGSQFQFDWGRRTVADLFIQIVDNMPEDDPGSLEDGTYADIVAYILQLNGFPAGSTELPADTATLQRYGLASPLGVGPARETR